MEMVCLNKMGWFVVLMIKMQTTEDPKTPRPLGQWPLHPESAVSADATFLYNLSIRVISYPGADPVVTNA
jgi:hypothetical protein